MNATDPYNSPGYQTFVESMVPHCQCDHHNRPCDGVLAGGPCDGIRERDEYHCEPDDE